MSQPDEVCADCRCEAAEKRGRQQLHDGWVPNRFDVRVSDRQFIEPQHAPGCTVGELNAALLIVSF